MKRHTRSSSVFSDSGWNDAALIVTFRNRPSAHIQTELACRDEGMNLNSLISLAISLDHHVKGKRDAAHLHRPTCCFRVHTSRGPSHHHRLLDRPLPSPISSQWKWGLPVSYHKSDGGTSRSSPLSTAAHWCALKVQLREKYYQITITNFLLLPHYMFLIAVMSCLLF